MTCPDWAGLIASRRRLGGDDPQGWETAVAHLDGCNSCRSRAERLEPVLAFRRLPGVEVSPQEIDEMRQRVAVLRRARQVEQPAGPSRRRWGAAAASAVLAAGLLASSHGAGPLALDEALEVAAVREPLSASLLAELAIQPVLEHLEQPFDQVVQWSSEELSMILLLDERLDV